MLAALYNIVFIQVLNNNSNSNQESLRTRWNLSFLYHGTLTHVMRTIRWSVSKPTYICRMDVKSFIIILALFAVSSGVRLRPQVRLRNFPLNSLAFECMHAFQMQIFINNFNFCMYLGFLWNGYLIAVCSKAGMNLVIFAALYFNLGVCVVFYIGKTWLSEIHDQPHIRRSPSITLISSFKI